MRKLTLDKRAQFLLELTPVFAVCLHNLFARNDVRFSAFLVELTAACKVNRLPSVETALRLARLDVDAPPAGQAGLMVLGSPAYMAPEAFKVCEG